MSSIVSVSGFGWSGSGAVVDLLREYNDVDILDAKGADFEFDLLPAIFDLDYGLNVKNARMMSAKAIAEFRSAIDFFVKERGYDRVFDSKFGNLANKYVEDFIDFSFWGWDFFDNVSPANKWKNSYNNIISHVFNNRITTHSKLSHRIWTRLTVKVNHRMSVSYYPENFMERTKEFLNTLFDQKHVHKDYPLIVDQMFPPDQPELFMKYVDGAKCIVVRRDPRDTYLLAKCGIKYMSVPLPIENVDDFIVFYRKIVENTKVENNASLLSIRFEDLIYKYDETINKIEEFLHISEHSNVKGRFNPAVSINNTQLFKKYIEYGKDIEKIEKALAGSLYNFDKYDFQRTSSEVF